MRTRKGIAVFSRRTTKQRMAALERVKKQKSKDK